jgi:hypothetical protein
LKNWLILILVVLISNQTLAQVEESININRKEYKDKLRGFWLGSCIANWTGLVNITLDGVDYGAFSLENHSSIHGQHYIKIFEKLDLSSGSHTLVIQGDENAREKTIDMLSIIKSE